MRLNERLIAVAEIWSQSCGRSVATLSSKVANDGKLIDALRDGKGCNVATAERFFAFFRDPANWPDATVPTEVGDFLNEVDLGVVHAASDTIGVAGVSSGKIAEISQQVPA